jgi:hypothetical protein
MQYRGVNTAPISVTGASTTTLVSAQTGHDGLPAAIAVRKLAFGVSAACTVQFVTVAAGSAAWQASTSYAAGQIVGATGTPASYYVCAVGGLSGGTAPTWATGINAQTMEKPSSIGGVSTAAWAGQTAYSAGQIVGPVGKPLSYYACATAGTSGLVQPNWTPNPSVAAIADPTYAIGGSIVQPWKPGWSYPSGQAIGPMGNPPSYFTANNAGTTGVGPTAWRLGSGATTVDGGITWTWAAYQLSWTFLQTALVWKCLGPSILSGAIPMATNATFVHATEGDEAEGLIVAPPGLGIAMTNSGGNVGGYFSYVVLGPTY